MRPYLEKNPSQKRVGGVVQDPEFKPQYCQNKEKKKEKPSHAPVSWRCVGSLSEVLSRAFLQPFLGLMHSEDSVPQIQKIPGLSSGIGRLIFSQCRPAPLATWPTGLKRKRLALGTCSSGCCSFLTPVVQKIVFLS
jgi:hypothetical protein